MTEGKSDWESALTRFRYMEENGLLGDIDPIPDEIHERAGCLARAIVRDRPREIRDDDRGSAYLSI